MIARVSVFAVVGLDVRLSTSARAVSMHCCSLYSKLQWYGIELGGHRQGFRRAWTAERTASRRDFSLPPTTETISRGYVAHMRAMVCTVRTSSAALSRLLMIPASGAAVTLAIFSRLVSLTEVRGLASAPCWS